MAPLTREGLDNWRLHHHDKKVVVMESYTVSVRKEDFSDSAIVR